MGKQNFNETNSSSPKRFRPDMASIRAKQTTPVNNHMNNNKRPQIPYRNNHNQYQQQQQQILSPSPTRENFDDNMKQLVNESKQLSDLELTMNCFDEGLSEAQLEHCPVKVNFIRFDFYDLFSQFRQALDRTDTTNGITPKPRNPVGRPRLHPRYPPTNTTTTPTATTINSTARRRTNYVDDDPDELDDLDEWNSEEPDQDDTVRDRDWVNRQQDDRLPWSKRNNSTVNNNYSSTYQRGGTNANAYRNVRQPAPLQQQQRNSINNQQRPTRGQFYQTQFVKPEPTRKATIPFLQPAFAPNASTQYPRDQPLPRLKPGTVRTRGKFSFLKKKKELTCLWFIFIEEGLEVELGSYFSSVHFS